MFFPEGNVRVYLYGKPVDMRNSYDGLYALARNGMQGDPLICGGWKYVADERSRERAPSCRDASVPLDAT